MTWGAALSGTSIGVSPVLPLLLGGLTTGGSSCARPICGSQNFHLIPLPSRCFRCPFARVTHGISTNSQFVRALSKSKYSSRAFYGQYKRPRACSSPAFSFYELSFLQPPLYSFVAGTSSHHVCDRSLPSYTSILLPQIQQHMKCPVSKITLLLFVDRNQYRRF